MRPKSETVYRVWVSRIWERKLFKSKTPLFLICLHHKLLSLNINSNPFFTIVLLHCQYTFFSGVDLSQSRDPRKDKYKFKRALSLFFAPVLVKWNIKSTPEDFWSCFVLMLLNIWSECSRDLIKIIIWKQADRDIIYIPHPNLHPWPLSPPPAPLYFFLQTSLLREGGEWDRFPRLPN